MELKIEYLSRLSPNIVDKLIFINKIRNGYAEEYLHDSRTFTFNETMAWFFKLNYDDGLQGYYIVKDKNDVIGYVRIANYSKINKRVMIGVDIAPEFSVKGYATNVYKYMIEFLFRDFDLNKISLEVLATNERAIKLYTKLKFKFEGIKRQDILKGDAFVDSIIMSILKSEYTSK